jgi:hypothetical protein
MHHRSCARTIWTLGFALTGSEASAQAAEAVASRSSSAPPIAAESTTVATPVTPPVAAPPLFSDILANAFASFGYTYNMNTPASRLNSYRVFDSDDNTFNVDVAELVLQKPVAKAGEAGFRMDLEVGGAIPQKEQSYGLSVGQSADLQQAFLSYVAPVGSGMRLDFGKFVTHMGSEVIEGYDGYNDNYTRSFLFNYAIPLTHTGIKASYAVNGALSGMLMLVNGWDNAKDNNRSKTLGAQIVLTPVPPVTLYLNYLGGPEKADTNGYARNTYDVIANWRVLKTFTLGVNGDYGVEKRASLIDPGADAVWKGVAGYARLDVTSKLTLALRGETFHDLGGTRLGVAAPATLGECTFTPTYKVGDRFIVRSDLRFDRANAPLFAKNGGFSDKQTTVSTNIIFVY